MHVFQFSIQQILLCSITNNNMFEEGIVLAAYQESHAWQKPASPDGPTHGPVQSSPVQPILYRAYQGPGCASAHLEPKMT